MPQEQSKEQPQLVDEVDEDAEAEEDSESESGSDDNDQEDTVMVDGSEVAADASADGQEATVDVRDQSAGQSAGLSRRQKDGDKPQRRNARHHAAEAVAAASDWQKHTSGKRRKKKGGGKTPQSQKPKDG